MSEAFLLYGGDTVFYIIEIQIIGGQTKNMKKVYKTFIQACLASMFPRLLPLPVLPVRPQAMLFTLVSSPLYIVPEEGLLSLIKCCSLPAAINQFHQLFISLFTTKEAR